MYANPTREHEPIVLAKARLELEQQKLGLATAKAQAQAEASDAISDMAKSGIEAVQQDQASVARMAKIEMGRRTNRSTERSKAVDYSVL